MQYDPPAGLTPAEVGVILDEDAGLKDVSAIIIDLAVRGYLRIREVQKKGLVFTETDYEFDRLKDFNNDAELRPFEKHLLTSLFGPTAEAAGSGAPAARDIHSRAVSSGASLFRSGARSTNRSKRFGVVPRYPLKRSAMRTTPSTPVVSCVRNRVSSAHANTA